MNIYSSEKVLPYVYICTHKETGEFYIGVRLKPKCPKDLGIHYFTSSQIIKNIGFENFEYEILEEFDSQECAYRFEQSLIMEHISDPKCINRHFHTTDSKMFINKPGYRLSVDTRRKMCGRKNTPEHVAAIVKAHTGKIVSEETRKKQSEAAKNRDRTSAAYYAGRLSHSEKMSGTGNPQYGKYGKDHPAYGIKYSEEHKKKKEFNRRGRLPKFLIIFKNGNTGEFCLPDFCELMGESIINVKAAISVRCWFKDYIILPLNS